MLSKEFEKKLERLINEYSVENECDTPDFILAAMVCGFIENTGIYMKRNLDWHGCDSVCHPSKDVHG